MHERELSLQEALAHIDERWDEGGLSQRVERAQRMWQARQRRKAVLAAASTLALLGGLAFALTPREAPPTAAAPAANSAVARVVESDRAGAPRAQGDAPMTSVVAAVEQYASRRAADSVELEPRAMARDEAQRIQLEDGSQIVLLGVESRVNVRQDSRSITRVELTRGRARFEVTPRPERVFRVQSRAVSVQVLGTVFELEQMGAHTHVRVERGRVAVSWPKGRRELSVAESGTFPPLPLSRANASHASNGVAAASGDVRASAVHGEQTSPSLDAHGGEPSSWRDTAKRGEYARAYALLQEPGPVPLSVDELLLAADAARLSGHPDAALPYLRRVVDEHAQDSRASLAAFTLGGVLMQQLDRPSEARAAYAKARALTVHSSLAQDALAREVEAAQRAGDKAQARELAEEYLKRYPDGRRVQAVRRFAGMSEP